MGDTTISLSEETKAHIEEHKPDGMTWDYYLQSVCDEYLDGDDVDADTDPEQLDSITEQLQELEGTLKDLQTEMPETVSRRVLDALR